MMEGGRSFRRQPNLAISTSSITCWRMVPKATRQHPVAMAEPNSRWPPEVDRWVLCSGFWCRVPRSMSHHRIEGGRTVLQAAAGPGALRKQSLQHPRCAGPTLFLSLSKRVNKHWPWGHTSSSEISCMRSSECSSFGAVI